jgi:putative FmdB family regulatory protein
MPMYEYVCSACGAAFERYVRAWGEPASCPRCGSGDVLKQLSTFALAATGAGAGSSRGGCGCGRGSCGCHH